MMGSQGPGPGPTSCIKRPKCVATLFSPFPDSVTNPFLLLPFKNPIPLLPAAPPPTFAAQAGLRPCPYPSHLTPTPTPLTSPLPTPAPSPGPLPLVPLALPPPFLLPQASKEWTNSTWQDPPPVEWLSSPSHLPPPSFLSTPLNSPPPPPSSYLRPHRSGHTALGKSLQQLCR